MDHFVKCVNDIMDAVLQQHLVIITTHPQVSLELLLEVTREKLLNIFQSGAITWEEYDNAMSRIFSDGNNLLLQRAMKNTSLILRIQVEYRLECVVSSLANALVNEID